MASRNLQTHSSVLQLEWNTWFSLKYVFFKNLPNRLKGVKTFISSDPLFRFWMEPRQNGQAREKKQNNVFWSIFQWWMFPLPRGINSENADAASTVPVSTERSSLRLPFIWNLVPLEFQKDNSTPPKCQLHLAPHRYHPTSSPLPQICHIFCPTSRIRWAVFIQWSIMKFVGVSLVCRQQINSKPNSSIPFSIATVWCCDLVIWPNLTF